MLRLLLLGRLLGLQLPQQRLAARGASAQGPAAGLAHCHFLVHLRWDVSLESGGPGLGVWTPLCLFWDYLSLFPSLPVVTTLTPQRPQTLPTGVPHVDVWSTWWESREPREIFSLLSRNIS